MRQTFDPRDIPPEHLMDPRGGQVGFRGLAAQMPPEGWQVQHRLAESGGYFRLGRRWVACTDPLAKGSLPIPIPCVPVSLLYRLLFARIGGRNGYEQGWCVDA